MDEIRSARRVLVFDAVVGLMFVAFVLIVTQRIANESGENYDAFAVVLIVACGASITIRRRMPDLALAISIIAIAIYTLRDYEGGPIYLAPLVPLYTLASLRERRELIVPVGSALLVLLGVGLAAPDRGKNIWYHIAFTSWAAAALFLGDGARTRRAYLQQLEQRARDLEESRDEETRRRLAEERLRIARDLHDVIAHGIATINMQSGVAAHLYRRHPEQVVPALQAIKQVSKEMLADLRMTLHVLRQDGERPDDPMTGADECADVAAPLAPTPGLDRVGGLVEMTRRAGLPVELRLGDGIADLPAAVDVAAYRIVQESLANVMRHADASRVEVTVCRSDGQIDIDVADDGLGAAANGSGVPGHGIVGMRERAEMVGGRLEAGPLLGGGFRVHASLPVAAVAQ
ncbi:MAG TPA: histidine kinase [Ilumatobacteraceae bacterium]